MGFDKSREFERLLGGCFWKLLSLQPDRPSKDYFSKAEKYMTQVSLLLYRRADTGYFVVPAPVLQELASYLKPTEVGYVRAIFGSNRSYCIRLSAMLEGLDENIWQLLPLAQGVGDSWERSTDGTFALAAYLHRPASILGPIYEDVPSFMLFDPLVGDNAKTVLTALNCPFDRADIEDYFSRCPSFEPSASQKLKRAEARFSADADANIYASWIADADERTIRISKMEIDALRALPGRERLVRFISARLSIDDTLPLDELHLPSPSSKTSQNPFYSLQLPPLRRLVQTQLSLI